MLTFFLLICVIGMTFSQREGLKPISIPALGQQFSLGELYDRHREKTLPGPKLWNSKELERYQQVSNYGTYFQVIAASDVKDNMNHFGLSASLKMSFLAGMIDVQGSASYLQDRKKRNRQARVSLGYKSGTFKRTLAPDLFTRVTFPEVLKQEPDATDVVVAIQYGAGAIFTFDRLVDENENVRDIQGRLHISVTKLPSFAIDGTGYINMTDKQKKEVEQFSCTFHGDFNLKTHPGTYKEAIEVYKQLPSLLGEHFEHSVPVKVWLYPIEKLPVERSAQFVYDINESVVSSVTAIISDLEGLTRECRDILSSTVARRHGRIHHKVSDFEQYIQRYILQFKQHVSKILPQVRKGGAAIEELSKLISKKESSPFSKRSLEVWLSYFKEEVEALSQIQTLPNYCRNDGDFSARLFNNVRFTIGLTLHLGKMDEPYLKKLKDYLDKEEQDIAPFLESEHKWFSPGSKVLSDLYVLSTSVRDFNDRIKEKLMLGTSDIQFLVREKIMQEGGNQGITIEFYDRAVLEDENYPLTSPPGRPKQIEKTHESITLEWTKPEKGLSKLKSYKVNVYVRRQKGETKDCTAKFCKISSISTRDTKKTITGLKAQTAYFFTISAYTDLDETSVSSMTNEIVTNKCCAGTYHVTKYECKECGPGMFSDKIGMTSCDTCPSGTYNPTSRATTSDQCLKCPAGTYNPKEGSVSRKTCVPCSIGTYSSHLGANDPNTCQKCAKGTYGDRVGLSLCNPCPKDTYNPDEGRKVCSKCPPETHTQSLGASSPSECLGKDAVAAAQRKVNNVKTKLGQVDRIISSMLEVDELRLTDAIQKFPDQEKQLYKDIDSKMEAVVKEMKIVHKCSWKHGEGSSRGGQHMEIPNAKTREDCLYKCIQLRKSNPSKRFNAVSRKISTGTCMCIENITVVATSRYEHCEFDI